MDENALLIQLAEALALGLRKAVAQARRDRVGDRFYAFILYTSSVLEYIALSFNTEEAFAQIVKTGEADDYLRWSPEEWEYNRDVQEFFKPVNEILVSLLQSQGYSDASYQSRWDTFMHVLKRLDGEGIFADAQNRDSVLVNILWGDQDAVVHVRSARELNPMSSYLRYAKYQLPILNSLAKEIEGSQSMYAKEALVRVCHCIEQVEADLRNCS